MRRCQTGDVYTFIQSICRTYTAFFVPIRLTLGNMEFTLDNHLGQYGIHFSIYLAQYGIHLGQYETCFTS